MRRLFLTLILCLLTTPAHAAIAEDAVTSTTGDTSTSHSHTVGATANIAIICVAHRETGGAVQTDTAVTFAGDDAIFLAGFSQGGVMRSELWYYLAPPAGSQTVAVTGATNTDYIVTGVITFSGVAQTSTFGTAVTAGGTASSNIDLDSIGSAVGEVAVLCGAVRTPTGADPTASADPTAPVSLERYETTHATDNALFGIAYTEAGDTPSINMRVDLSGPQQWAGVAVSIRPAASADYLPFGRRN